MKNRWWRVPFFRSRSYRKLFDRAIADGFASLEPKSVSRRETSAGRPRRRESGVRTEGWAPLAGRQPEDSLA
jgi:hypothetical protein